MNSKKGKNIKRLSTPQTIFDRTVRAYILKQARQNVKWGIKNTVKEAKEDLDGSLGFYFFHTKDTVSVDATLWEVMNDRSDFGAYSDLKVLIDLNLRAKGYYMEAQNGCDWIFAEGETWSPEYQAKVLAWGNGEPCPICKKDFPEAHFTHLFKAHKEELLEMF